MGNTNAGTCHCSGVGHLEPVFVPPETAVSGLTADLQEALCRKDRS